MTQTRKSLFKVGVEKCGSKDIDHLCHLKELSETEYSELQSHREILEDYFGSVKIADTVRLNLEELARVVARYIAEYSKVRSLSVSQIDEISTNLGRLVLNILSTFRTFLDHADGLLCRKYGKKSEERESWEKILNKEYDSNFEYRFISHLRNYCQHVGLPPMNISYKTAINREEFEFIFNFDRQGLLKRPGEWKEKIRNELSTLDTELCVIDVLTGWGESFSRIVEMLRWINSKRTLPAAKGILAYRSEFGVSDHEDIYIVEHLGRNDVTGENKAELTPLPEKKAFEFCRHVQKFSKNK